MCTCIQHVKIVYPNGVMIYCTYNVYCYNNCYYFTIIATPTGYVTEQANTTFISITVWLQEHSYPIVREWSKH